MTIKGLWVIGFAIVITTAIVGVLYLLRSGKSEPFADAPDVTKGTTVNLVNEYAHFRYQLDVLDRKAAANPKDKVVAAERQQMEALLTQIADFIQKNGRDVSLEDADRLVVSMRNNLS